MNSHLPLPSKNLTLWKLGQSVQHQRRCPGFYPAALLLLLLNNYIAKGILCWRNILRARGKTVLFSHSHVHQKRFAKSTCDAYIPYDRKF